MPICDCTNAIVPISNVSGAPLQRFVGKQCHKEVRESDYCPGQAKRGTNREFFCVNRGRCRNGQAGYKNEPCQCSNGYMGRHCEYHPDQDVGVQAECTLGCNDVGKCFHGVHPFSDNGANGILDLHHKGTDKYMYCHCDETHAGTNCEYQVTKCSGQTAQGKAKYCFHGATCSADAGAAICHCNVTTTEKHCKCTATILCVNTR